MSADLPGSKKNLLLLALIVAVGLGLRLYRLSDHGMFVDEVYSVLVATGTGDPELMRFDASRPFYFFLLKLWHMLGSDDGWLRLFSVLFGTANIVLLYILGKLAGGARLGLAAALITALSPMEIHYSQQVRMYTLGSCLVLSGTYALIKAFETSKKIFLALWAILRLLMVLTLPLTAVLLGIDVLYAAAHLKDKDKRPLLPLMGIGAAAIAACWAPFLLILLQAQSSPYDSWRSSLDKPNALDFLTLLVNFTASAIPLQESGGPPIYDFITGTYVLIFPVILALALFYCRKEKTMRWLALWGLLPLTGLFVYSLFRPPLFITRYSMFTAPFVYLLLAFGWSEIYKLKKYGKYVGICLAIIYGLAMTSFINYFYNHQVHEDWRRISAYLTEHERAGDEIIVWNYHSKYLLGYYYKGKNRVSDLEVGKSDDENNNGLVISLELDPPPKTGQRLWIVTREAAPGWHNMREVYEDFSRAVTEHYKILNHKNLGMSDIYEVQEP